MILMLSPTSWGWSRTSTFDVADASDENVPVAFIPDPMDPLIYT